MTSFLCDEMKLKPNAITGMKDISGICDPKMFNNKTNKHWELAVAASLKPVGCFSVFSNTEGQTGYVASPQYIPRSPIHMSIKSILWLQHTSKAVWFHEVYSQTLIKEGKYDIIEQIAKQLMIIEEKIEESQEIKLVVLKNSNHCL